MLEAQVSKGYRRKGIDSDGYYHYHYELRIIAHFHQRRELRIEQPTEEDKDNRGRCYRRHSGGIDEVGLLAVGIGGEAEITRLHTVGNDHYHQGYPRIELRYNTIVGSRDDMQMERHQKPIEKPPYDAACTVDCSLFCKIFNSQTAHCSFIEMPKYRPTLCRKLCGGQK